MGWWGCGLEASQIKEVTSSFSTYLNHAFGVVQALANTAKFCLKKVLEEAEILALLRVLPKILEKRQS